MSIIQSPAELRANDRGRRIRWPDAEYESLIQEWINEWLAAGAAVSLEEIFLEAEPDMPANRLLREYAEKVGHKPADITRALNNVRIKKALGCVPQSPLVYVQAVAKKRVLKVRVNGLIDRHETPFDDIRYSNGEVRRYEIEEGCLITEAHVQHHFRRPIRLDEFRLSTRVEARELGLRFRGDEVNDAVDEWAAAARREREFDIRTSVDFTYNPVARDKIFADLVDLCRATFDSEAQPAEYAAAAIRKFVWQVRRKLAFIPVTNHQMLIWTGRQGVGKSVAMKKLISPLAELSAPCDFAEITDSRNISLWSNFILVADEMSWASKSNIDTVKNVVTADDLQRRPMRTNDTVSVRQCATLIGASNKESLADLIRDNTGVRRFLAIRYSDTPDWAALNSFNWLELWRAVDPRMADPMEEFKELVAEHQEADRERCNAESWLESLIPSISLGGTLNKRDEVTARELYEDFRRWEEEFAPGDRTSEVRFGLDLKQLRANGLCPFKKLPRRTAGSFYSYDGPKGFSLLQGGMAAE
jgi:hypothetical protein